MPAGIASRVDNPEKATRVARTHVQMCHERCVLTSHSMPTFLPTISLLSPSAGCILWPGHPSSHSSSATRLRLPSSQLQAFYSTIWGRILGAGDQTPRSKRWLTQKYKHWPHGGKRTRKGAWNHAQSHLARKLCGPAIVDQGQTRDSCRKWCLYLISGGSDPPGQILVIRVLHHFVMVMKICLNGTTSKIQEIVCATVV
jgi:hypothetical protein